jgi:glycosyltransferase involved in cell wall biosynthesis
MLNILINAYACSPNWGSEQGMAWNWIVNLAQYCNLYIITEGEYKDLIEDAVERLPQKDNIHFYYNPLSDSVRRMCWNQGDWRFYYYYRKWQKSTYRIALQLIKERRIDIVHQLNMIGFREPGFLWKIKALPYVWGPVGGMELMPVAYLDGVSIKQKLAIYLKNYINTFQTRYSFRVRKAIHRADVLIAAVKGVEEQIRKYYRRNVVLINETGCYPSQYKIEERHHKETFDILWVGKFDFRKQLGLALKTVAEIKQLANVQFHVVGEGTDRETGYYKSMAERLGISGKCRWYGKIPNTEVQKIMQKSDLLLFTSIMEGTSHVVLESIGNYLPILCFDICGQATSVNNNVGVKIRLSTPKQSVKDFAQAINHLYSDRDLLRFLSLTCKQRQNELSWESKAKLMVELYKSVL